jgi:MFS family permease
MQLLTTISAVTELVPTSRRGITIGYIVIGFMPFAPGSLYGQQLATHSWRWVCVFVGVMAVAAFIIIAIFYNPPPRPNAEGLTKRQILARIDYLGGFLSISGVVLFLVGINWGGEAYTWSDRHVIATLTVGLFLIVCFWAWEYFGAPYPMFPASLATHKKMFTAVLLLCLTSGINYIPGIVFWVIQVYTVYGASYAQAGVYLLPIGFCIAGGAIISAVLMTVFKRHIHWILLGFCIMQTAGKSSSHATLRSSPLISSSCFQFVYPAC